MKKFKAFSAMALLSVALFSCSSDDDSGSAVTLEGRWYNASYRVNNGPVIPYDDHETCEGQLRKDYVDLLANNTGKFVDIWNCNEEEDPFTYSVSGNMITLTYTGEEPEMIEIVTLNSNELVIKAMFDVDEDGDQDEILETYTRD